jgi:hypothetical protein
MGDFAMASQRKHTVHPNELLDARRVELRRKLLAFLQNNEPAWREEDHPELRDGSGAWVRKLRGESEVGMDVKNVLKKVPNRPPDPGDELE